MTEIHEEGRLMLRSMRPWIMLTGRLLIAYSAVAAIFAIGAILVITVARFPHLSLTFIAGILSGAVTMVCANILFHPFLDACRRLFRQSRTMGERLFQLEQLLGHLLIGRFHH